MLSWLPSHFLLLGGTARASLCPGCESVGWFFILRDQRRQSGLEMQTCRRRLHPPNTTTILASTVFTSPVIWKVWESASVSPSPSLSSSLAYFPLLSTGWKKRLPGFCSVMIRAGFWALNPWNELQIVNLAAVLFRKCSEVCLTGSSCRDLGGILF